MEIQSGASEPEGDTGIERWMIGAMQYTTQWPIVYDRGTQMNCETEGRVVRP